MLEKWKSTIDNIRNFGALLTDLSKAFDCLPHDLLLAKLNAYGFSLSASDWYEAIYQIENKELR